MNPYFDLAKPTYLENLPDELLRLSFATVFLPLSEVEVENLLGMYDLYNGEAASVDVKITEALARRIDQAIGQFPHGGFVKLGSRSPKDSYQAHCFGLCCLTGQDALGLLTASERVADDLHLAQSENYTPNLCVREWLDIPWHEEFRVFIRDRQVIGVSQYDYTQSYPSYPKDGSDPESIRWAIDTFFERYLEPALHLDTVIADVWLRCKFHGNTCTWGCKLIELNPFGNWTDPCLMSWRDVEVWSKAEPYEVRLKSA
jgi:hypothetical protein